MNTFKVTSFNVPFYWLPISSAKDKPVNIYTCCIILPIPITGVSTTEMASSADNPRRQNTYTVHVDGATYSVYLGESSSKSGALFTTSFITMRYARLFTHKCNNNTKNKILNTRNTLWCLIWSNKLEYCLCSFIPAVLFSELSWVCQYLVSSKSHWLSSVFKYS